MFRKYAGSLRYSKARACITQGVCLIWGLLNEIFTLNILSLDVQRNHTMSETKSFLFSCLIIFKTTVHEQ